MPTLQLQVSPLQNPSRYRSLARASDVIVREVPATDWGYGGQTQAARKLAPARQT